jgi:methylmalonyl-CoA epimerase
MLLGIDHTAIAVDNLDEALNRYWRLYGVTPSERAIIPEQAVEVAFLPMGDTQIELICPTDRDTGVGRFLDRHGEGLHHIGLRVDDIRAELRRLQSNGVRLVDSNPRPGLHGEIAFIHPGGTGGVLMELMQKHA